MLKTAACNKCSKRDWLTYTYRGRVFCHKCLTEVWMQANDRKRTNTLRQLGGLKPLYPDDDVETQETLHSWSISDLLERTSVSTAVVYAWHVCGYLHPRILDRYPALKSVDPTSIALSEAQLKRWDAAIEEFTTRGDDSESASAQDE